MNGHAQRLARAVLIFHSDGDPTEPAGNSFAAWRRATGTRRCNASVLCRLARRVLDLPEPTDERKEAAE